MTSLHAFALLLLIVHAPPDLEALESRARAGIERMVPCPEQDADCPDHHARAARAVAMVAAEDRWPDEAVVLLVATGAHESGFRTEDERGGRRRAVSYWMVETPTRASQAEARRDPLVAARWALHAARACRGTMRAYAFGGCDVGSPDQERAAAELRTYVQTARWMTLP
jgi:hypothetical protein